MQDRTCPRCTRERSTTRGPRCGTRTRAAYLEQTNDRFDFITVDLVEPLEDGPACMLFTQEFYTLVRDRLTPGGTMTMQAGMTKLGELAFFTLDPPDPSRGLPGGRRLPDLRLLLRHPVGLHRRVEEDRPRPSRAPAVDQLIAERIKGALEYWDGVTHQHAFSLPKFIRKAVAKQTRIVTDANPLILS